MPAWPAQPSEIGRTRNAYINRPGNPKLSHQRRQNQCESRPNLGFAECMADIVAVPGTVGPIERSGASISRRLRTEQMPSPKPAQRLASSYHVAVLSHGVSLMKHDTSFGVLTGNAIETISFKAGDVIFREGDNALDLFVIKSGQVRIQIGNRTVAELAPDTIFGE